MLLPHLYCAFTEFIKEYNGVMLDHSSPGKNSNLNAPVLLKGAEVAFFSGGKGRNENALQKRAALQR